MKAGWQSKRFEDCIEKVTYTAKVQRKDFLDTGEHPIVSQEEAFINGYWNEAADLFHLSRPVVVFGDHTKVLKYVDFDFVLGADGVKILTPKDFLAPRYFYYHLQTANLDSLGYARHYKLLKELEIAFPPADEQQRIVAILDEAFESIATAKANAEKNLQNARTLFESHLQSVLTQRCSDWLEKRLEEVCVIGDGNHSSNYPKKEELVAEGVPFIRATNLVAGEISDDDMRFLSPEKHAQLKKGHLKTGDILFTNRGEIGKTAIVDAGHDGSNLNSQIAWLRCMETLNNRFLFYVLNSGAIKSHLQLSKNGAALQQFTIRQIKELKIPIPPKGQQKALVLSLDGLSEETQRLESLYQQKLTALTELKKSLLHEAFSGRL